MSFITKRERVFNEYDLYELPSRNEGKLKAYSSCTDTRAWSHFSSDKSEHLTDIIRRNNETCRPKYVPTEAIVNTLLATKHAEIARLKRKIDEFEQMLAAYDELELTCDQKCEIAKAHAAIKEANKDLNELWFDLDLSGFTGIDSEDYETGKSRGDEPSRFRDRDGNETPRSKGEETPRSKGDEPSYSQQWSFEKESPHKETKGIQAGGKGGRVDCVCDASTNVVDPRIEQMQDSIISKDAKLNAMKNTMAVMENDVCEPYCIYAHIYTALEKIFGILCQNAKYRLYLNMMTAGKDTRCIDIKGKILFKLKVLEKFSLALIAPCSQDFAGTTSPDNECSCYRAEIATCMESSFALTSAEAHDTCLDTKRAHLIADIMENDEMKDILGKDNAPLKADEDIVIESYNVDKENFKRLKKLQENYDDLMTCYEALKHEKECLQIRCQKNADLEKEFEILQSQLREYNALWNEKEHYRKRSVDLDSLKEQYMILCDETTNLETELKAESEINEVKTKTIDELRNENMVLEKRLNEASVAFEKEKNYAQCKLKESECTIMCQGQQIKSLSTQIDRLLEQEPEKLQSTESDTPTIALIDEINSLKEQIKNLQDALYCSEEEKQQLQEEYQNMLKLINNLKIEVEDWKSNYEKTLQRNDYLEKYTTSFREEVHKLIEENTILTQSVQEKSNAIDNLIDVIKNKSQEVNNLMNDVEHKNKENSNLCDEIHNLRDAYDKSVTALNTEKSQTMKSLQIAQQESQELFEKVKDYDDIIRNQEDLYKKQTEEFIRLKALLIDTQKEKQSLQMDLTSSENNNSMLHKEIQRLQEVNNYAINDVSSLKDEKERYKVSLELTKKDSRILEEKLRCFENLSIQLQQLKESHEKLMHENCRLENELSHKTFELDNATREVQLTRKESQELEDKLESTENLKAEYKNIIDSYKKLIKEQHDLKIELNEKNRDFDNLLESFNNLNNSLEKINDQTSEEIEALSKELTYLKKTNHELLADKEILKNNCDKKTEELNNLYNTLQNKIDENRELSKQLKVLEIGQKSVQSKIDNLQEENFTTKNSLNVLKKESDELIDKIKSYEILELQYDQLQNEHERVKKEINRLQKELDVHIAEKKRIEEDNQALNNECRDLFLHGEHLEKALINARTELMVSTSNPKISQMEILREIEDMKSEKISNQHKIRDLFDKLDESENIISNLSETIQARDDKISILENHINKLQDEVKRLHSSLAEIVDTGEQIKDNSYQRIRESMNAMEAHHSKATHNMKMELAKLQNDNVRLEKRLSISKIKSDDSARDTHKYVSQIIDLQNEREIIVTDIKQLEMKSVGDSVLSPDQCDIEDILNSLDRIRRHVDARCSRSTSLEQTLLRVQNSYQVVQSKADEAKKIVENEKQKILNEKEEAIKDKITMGNQLTELKEQLKKQVSHDKNIIKDLESEILNHKLIFDKLNKSTQGYISKLHEEMQSVQDLYQKSIEKVSELEKRLQLMSEENESHLNVIENVKMNLKEKSNEIEMLKTDLAMLKNKSCHSLATQVLITESRDEETQTNIEFNYEGFDKTNVTENIKNVDGTNCELSTIHAKKPVLERKVIGNDTLKHVNEVQVLTASIEPTFDCIRSNYLNSKLKQLSLKRLEHYSISCTSENDLELENKGQNKPNIKKSNKVPSTDQSTENIHVIDIYNKQSMHTNSSKIIDTDYPGNKRDLKSPGKSDITDSGLINESCDTKSNIHRASNLFGSVSGVSTDKDLFIIYRDSETNYLDKSYDKKSRLSNGLSDTLDEAVTIHSDKDNQSKSKNKHARHEQKQYESEIDPFFYPDDEDDSVKHKLKISLTRVQNYSTVMDTASDGNKKSQESYIILYSVPNSTYSLSDHKMDKSLKIMENNLKAPSAHSLSNDEILYLDSYISTEDENVNRITKKPRSDNVDKNNYVIPLESIHGKTNPGSSFVKTGFDKDSHHRLSRINADIRLIKTKTDNLAMTDNKVVKRKPENFGLDYILATAHMEPENIKIYNATKSIRKARSNDLLNNSIKLHGRSDSSPSRISDEKKSLTDHKTVSSNKYSLMSQSKTYTERGIMAKLADPKEEYERKIKILTNHLENIENDYKKKIEAIKMQYDNNIKSILNEHNDGVKNMQGLHEETLQDVIKRHENEVENLRSMSIDAMRKADKLEKEVRSLKCKIPVCSSECSEEEPIKIPGLRKRKSRVDTKTLTKTNVEAFNVRPKSRSNGPCTCSLDINLSDTIRNTLKQVDVDQGKIAEHTYLKYIANKILSNNVEALDCQELSFLHLKVCRIWKVKRTKEESLQKRIDSLEAELMTRQRHTQNNMVELDRKVAEEKRRLQEVREAVCRNVTVSRYEIPDVETNFVASVSAAIVDTAILRKCDRSTRNTAGEQLPAGDLAPVAGASVRPKRVRPDSNRAVLAKLDAKDRREKKLYHDEPPTRLRRPHERQPMQFNKKY